MAKSRANSPVKAQRDSSGAREKQRVMWVLASAMGDGAQVKEAIVEQLKQCPEAFKVGEVLAKAFDRLKYGREETRGRLLPPAGAVLPPLA
jgi:hypothetical protein